MTKKKKFIVAIMTGIMCIASTVAVYAQSVTTTGSSSAYGGVAGTLTVGTSATVTAKTAIQFNPDNAYLQNRVLTSDTTRKVMWMKTSATSAPGVKSFTYNASGDYGTGYYISATHYIDGGTKYQGTSVTTNLRVE